MLHHLKSFRRDTRGAVALMFALLVLPLLGLASLALEQMQVSKFRQTLQTIAESGSRAGATIDETVPEHKRRDETVATLRRLLSSARLKPAEVGAKVDFARPDIDAGIVATVSLEATPTLFFPLLHGRNARIRVTASSGNVQDAAAERLMRCHVASTQAEFDSLGC